MQTIPFYKHQIEILLHSNQQLLQLMNNKIHLKMCLPPSPGHYQMDFYQCAKYTCELYYCIGILIILVCSLLENKWSSFYFLMNHGKVLKTTNYCFRIHKSKFWHFYLIALILFPLMLDKYAIPDIILFVHLVRRLAESLFLFQYSVTSYMHIVYIVGISYYPMLFIGISEANIKSNYFGTFLFLVLSLIQSKCHWILAKLKKQSQHRQFTPNEALFRLVWCPHYLLEILMYACLGVNRKLFLNFLFTFLNLSVSAYKTKIWIESTNRGKQKKYAVIPFIL